MLAASDAERLVAIDAQIQPNGQMGGVEHYLAALVRALGQLEGPERYLLVCLPEYSDWLAPYAGPNQRIVVGPTRISRRVKGIFGAAWPGVWKIGQRLWLWAARVSDAQRVPPGWVWESRGFFESLGATLLHVLYQKYVRTDLPVVFSPHDLQHEHFPEFFSPESLARRKFTYPAACRAAAAVVAGSRYTRDDVINQYHISPEKIWIIPAGPATVAFRPVTEEECCQVRAKYGLDEPFMLYPAVTWEHKNHLRLLDAIVWLRAQGLPVNLVCTGAQREPVWSRIQHFIAQNNLDSQARFLGYVSSSELRALYRSCRFVIAPSLFEQASGPMFEAWLDDVPVAASTATSLPDQAGDAALLFDPLSVEAIAEAVRYLWTDGAFREELRRRGRQRLADFSWERTAKAYRALYRRVAGTPLTDEDRYLLGWDWMRDPHRQEQREIT